MRPSRSSRFPRPRSPPSTDAAALDVVSTKLRHASNSSNSRSNILSPEIPPWAAAEVSPVDGSGKGARRQSDQSDSHGAERGLRGAKESDQPPRRKGQVVAAGHASPLEPLLTAGETAAILNVSERTVRRLIASKAIPFVLIGRSVRLRPRDVRRLIADGGVCGARSAGEHFAAVIDKLRAEPKQAPMRGGPRPSRVKSIGDSR